MFYMNMHISLPGTQNDPCFDWYFGLVLEGFSLQTWGSVSPGLGWYISLRLHGGNLHPVSS